MYSLSCPKCGAPPEKADLRVVAFTMSTNPGIPLKERGYNPFAADPHAAVMTETYDETVRCAKCGQYIELRLCRKDRKYGIESIILEKDNLQLRTTVFPEAAKYVRVVDVTGGEEKELAYWDNGEWTDGDDYGETVGTIMGAIKSILEGTFRTDGKP